MSNVRTSPKWKAIVQRNDGTAAALVSAVVMDKDDKLSTKEGLTVTVNGRTYILRNAPRSPIKQNSLVCNLKLFLRQLFQSGQSV